MNNVVLFGRMIAKPDLRFIAGSGMAAVNFTLAVDKGLSRDKKAEFESQGKPTADFIRCKAFGKRAETIANYFDKGSQIVVSGEINTGSYTDKDGKKVYTTDIMVNNFNFVSGGKSETKQENGGGFYDGFEIEDSSIPF